MNGGLMGRIIGFNTDSGMLYKTQCGLNQYKPKQNVVAPPVSYSNYSNKENTDRTLEEMNANQQPNYYRGKQEDLNVPLEAQPGPFTIKGGKEQHTSYHNKSDIKKIYD